MDSNLSISISALAALNLFMLAAFAGWVIIGRVPAILHTPLMSGSNFVHGIVVVGGVDALLNASTQEQQVLGFFAVLLGAGNAAGGYAVTDRMLAMFKPSIPSVVGAIRHVSKPAKGSKGIKAASVKHPPSSQS